jgi:YD repeat-containing protein
MKPIVVVFVPTGATAKSQESYVFALTWDGLRQRASINDADRPRDFRAQSLPPFWTWFIENPRPPSQSLRPLKD